MKLIIAIMFVVVSLYATATLQTHSQEVQVRHLSKIELAIQEISQ